MAYNKKNLLNKIIEIQNITIQKKHNEGLTYKRIYSDHIKPKYLISYSTFSRYMGINAKRELSNILEQESKESK